VTILTTLPRYSAYLLSKIKLEARWGWWVIQLLEDERQ